MMHTLRNQQKLLNRARWIRGQLEAVERALQVVDIRFSRSQRSF